VPFKWAPTPNGFWHLNIDGSLSANRGGSGCVIWHNESNLVVPFFSCGGAQDSIL
jgi:hypothetical protein